MRRNYINRRGMIDRSLTVECAAHLQAVLLRKTGQREAVSFALKELREDGFGGFTHLADFERALQEGFRLLQDRVDGGSYARVTYVVARGAVVEQRLSYRLEYHCGRGNRRWIYRHFRTPRAVVRFLKAAGRGRVYGARDEVGDVIRIVEEVE
jgi:hypothetical protein